MQIFIKGEQKARREDWISGPLAPNRDAGGMKGTYGSVPNIMQIGGKFPTRYAQGPKGEGSDYSGSEFRRRDWIGQGIQGNIVPGDRVAVIRGRPGVKGMIGTISRVEKDERQVFIRDVNKADVKAMPGTPALAGGIAATDLAINMSDVRLVIAMQDEEKGLHRDYIVREIRGGAPYLQREPGSNLPRHTRYIVGEEFEIPWPVEDVERRYTLDADTTRMDTEHQTYVPSLTYKPIEDGVIDELRGKYSRTRKTHDDLDWIKKKVVEDARTSWLEKRFAVPYMNRPPRPIQMSAESRDFVKKFRQMEV